MRRSTANFRVTRATSCCNCWLLSCSWHYDASSSDSHTCPPSKSLHPVALLQRHQHPVVALLAGLAGEFLFQLRITSHTQCTSDARLQALSSCFVNIVHRSVWYQQTGATGVSCSHTTVVAPADNAGHAYLLSLDCEGWMCLWDVISWSCLDMQRVAPLPSGVQPHIITLVSWPSPNVVCQQHNCAITGRRGN